MYLCLQTCHVSHYLPFPFLPLTIPSESGYAPNFTIQALVPLFFPVQSFLKGAVEDAMGLATITACIRTASS